MLRGYQSGGMPGNVIARELIPLGGGDLGGHCNSVLGLKLCNPLFLHFSGQSWQCLAPT